uniref:Polyprenyl synthetase family protein n=1 Tax=Thermomicrobium roseum TaxID=500 RepID=A0A7C1K0U7_THERO
MESEIQVVEDAMRAIVQRQAARFPAVEGSLPIYRVLSYHLGWLDERFQPTGVSSGKRFRPLLCLRACTAAGGTPQQAAWIAAAIELLHNFTLIHDDIQDRSMTRRHRPTVWALWGDAQAINAGDALFALSQLAALEAASQLEPTRGMELLSRLNETALRIVEGQVLDLSFESRDEVTRDEYFGMIERKTAALTAYAAWAGAMVAGASSELAERFADFGRALGLGFQVQDDYLGVWGDPLQTGKARGDDLRRRKKSLPILILLERASPDDRAWIHFAWRHEQDLDPATVERLLTLLEQYGVEAAMQETVRRLHVEALACLGELGLPAERTAPLHEIVERLAVREA